MMKTKTMKGFQAVAAALINNNVTHLFGLIGDANLFAVDSFIRDHGGTFVTATHEASAVLMAMGYSLRSGKIGVASVTHGPGLSNCVTPLIEAVKGSCPMVLVCGDTPPDDRFGLQKISQRDLIMPTGAGFIQVRGSETIGEDIALAFRLARIERRPIVVNVPAEFNWRDVTFNPTRLHVPDNRAFVPESADLDEAIGIIAAARRPVIVAGRGVLDEAARDAVLTLARRIEAPVGTTLKGKCLFAGDDFNLGIVGTVSSPVTAEIVMESDCLIGVGASLNKYTMSHGAFVDGKRIVQLNLEPEEVGKHLQPTAGLVGDIERTIGVILGWLDEAEIPASGYANDEMKAKIAAFSLADEMPDCSTDTTLDLRQAMLAVNDLLPSPRTMVTDTGRFMGEAWKVIDVAGPRSFVMTANYACIGLGMGHAIGAAAAAGDELTVLIAGDGGFMLGGLTEFHTAIRHKLDIVVVLCNDGGYGAEHIQFRQRDMAPETALLEWPDFAKVATAMGGHGITVRTMEELKAARAAIENRDRPVLIDIHIDPDSVEGLR